MLKLERVIMFIESMAFGDNPGQNRNGIIQLRAAIPYEDKVSELPLESQRLLDVE